MLPSYSFRKIRLLVPFVVVFCLSLLSTACAALDETDAPDQPENGSGSTHAETGRYRIHPRHGILLQIGIENPMGPNGQILRTLPSSSWEANC